MTPTKRRLIRRESIPAQHIQRWFEASGDIFTFKTLGAIDELTQRYIEVDSALAVSSILNYRLNESDKQTYGRNYLIPELDTLTEADLVQIKEIALADEDLLKSLLSPQGDFTIASIKFKVSEDTAEKRLAVAESAVALRDLREKFPEVGLIIGGPMFELDVIWRPLRTTKFCFP